VLLSGIPNRTVVRASAGGPEWRLQMTVKRLAHLCVFAIVLVFCASSSGAQSSGRVFKVGVLALGSSEDMQSRLAFLREPLRDLGYEEGKNLTVESRFANSDYERLARLKIDVFVAAGEPALLAAKEKGESIPIVVVSCDPLEKLLGSLARPGGNATGFTCVSSDLVGKRFSLLRSLLPGMRRVAMLYNKRDNHELEFRDAEAAARSLNIALLRFPVVSAAEFESTFKMMNEEKSDALYIFASGFAQGHWTRLARLALDHRLPAIYAFREFADRGGLLSYGASNADAYRRAAALVDKILKGLRPSDLPVEQPTRFELIINARTAKALGVTIPDVVLVQAHEVIE
jgi:putative ABC transport system substrate-binding protein